MSFIRQEVVLTFWWFFKCLKCEFIAVLKNFIFFKMIINEQEFCWRVCCHAFYFMFPQKQAWFPCTNKFIPYSNAWHIYAKVLEIKTYSTVFFSTRPVSHFFLFSSLIKSEWRVDSETHCEDLHLTVYWQRPQKWTNFFFSFALTNCALHCWKPTSLPYTLVYVNNVIY